jgi:hypothetical protein
LTRILQMSSIYANDSVYDLTSDSQSDTKYLHDIQCLLKHRPQIKSRANLERKSYPKSDVEPHSKSYPKSYR